MGYLLQHFKKAIIQNLDPNKPTPPGGQPYCPQMRWYGATYTGLCYICFNGQLWGRQRKIACDDQLSKMPEHLDNTPTEIQEFVVDKCLGYEEEKGVSQRCTQRGIQ